MLKATCGICRQELTRWGAMLLAPPNFYGQETRYFICVSCWTTKLRTLLAPGGAAPTG